MRFTSGNFWNEYILKYLNPARLTFQALRGHQKEDLTPTSIKCICGLNLQDTVQKLLVEIYWSPSHPLTWFGEIR